MKTLFLDESGDHNLTAIDPQYPVFVLGGVIVDTDYAAGPLTAALNNFKRELFGRVDITLHTAAIARNRNGFEALRDRDFRNRFYDGLNALMRGLEYSVIACAIRKSEFLNRYGAATPNPYLFSFPLLAEIFCYDIGNVSRGGIIIAERRGARPDRELEREWSNLIVDGTRRIRGQEISRRIADLRLQTKADNIAGLQLADLAVSPIGRHVLGKSDKEDWSIIAGKLRRNRSGEVAGAGLIVLPK